MSSILKVDQLQDSGGNAIITSNGSGTITVNSQPFKNGITMADGWRLTANTNTGTAAVVSTNWERMDTNEFSQIGTGLTESSGVFTFPTTGIYWIHYVGRLTLNGNDTSANFILETTNDNSTWSNGGYATGGNGSGTNAGGSASGNNIFDVQDTSNYKIRFSTGSFGTATNLNGITSDNRTHFIVIRLGDT
jgi:hypothetical protein